MKGQLSSSKQISLKHNKWQEFLNIAHYSRVYQWHPGKLPIFIGITLTLALENNQKINLTWLAGAYALTFLYLASGYMLNNLSDTYHDFAAGKSIGLENWKPNSVLLLVISVTAVGIISTILFAPAKIIPWALFCYTLAFAYSYRPRLKEHVFGGPIVAAFTQIPAPAIAVAIYCDKVSFISVLYIIVAFLFGLRMIFVHHLIDYENDILTGISTTATFFGKKRIYSLLYSFFGVETLLTCILIISIFKTSTQFFMIVFFTIPLVIAIKRALSNKSFRLDSYEYIPLADIHESILPLILTLTIAIKLQREMLFLPPLLILFFLKRYYERIIFPFKSFS